MRSYDSLGGRGQLRRLRGLGRAALARYPLDLAASRLTPLRHEQNATFRIDAPSGWFVLRVSRPEAHTPASVASEMAWLAALRRETDLRVPDPVATRDGLLVTSASADGVPGPRLCVLLRWTDGRFVDRGLTPAHLHRVGSLIASLHEHASTWEAPRGFVRPRIDTLTAAAKRSSFATSDRASAPATWPTPGDADAGLDLVAELMDPADTAVVERALTLVRDTTATLGGRRDPFGLIHGDLHQENVLHSRRTAGAIDFDDCGWGFHLYDLAVPLSELTARPRYEKLRAALLDGYVRSRPLPPDAESHIDAFIVLRGLQLLLWILESREHAAFRDHWQTRARAEVRWLASLTDEVAVR